MIKKAFAAAFTLLACSALISGAAFAEDFYKGKTVKIIVGYTPGGGYDVYARVLAKHIGKYIPGNPNVIVENMPGAGSLASVNYLYEKAPKDGTEFGTFSRTLPLTALTDQRNNSRFKAEELTWIGTPTSYQDDAYLLFVRSDVPVKTLDELKNPPRVINMGNTAPGSSSADITLLMAAIFDLKVKEISGYPGGSMVSLAIERGELDGRMMGLSAINSSMPHWLPEKRIRPLLQFGRETRHSTLPDVPTARELAKGNADAMALIELAEAPYLLARPFAGPPGIPADRVKILREAFMKTNADPGYLAEAKKLDIDISPKDGAEVAELIHRLGQVPPDLIHRYETILASGIFTPRAVNLVDVSGKILGISKEKVQFESGGKTLRTEVDADGTELKIGGKKGKVEDLKVGMSCDISYEGDQSVATKMACK